MISDNRIETIIADPYLRKPYLNPIIWSKGSVTTKYLKDTNLLISEEAITNLNYRDPIAEKANSLIMKAALQTRTLETTMLLSYFTMNHKVWNYLLCDKSMIQQYITGDKQLNLKFHLNMYGSIEENIRTIITIYHAIQILGKYVYDLDIVLDES